MAVTDIIEQLPGAVGSWNLQAGYTLTARLNVKADRADGPMTIFAAVPVNVGDTYRYPLTRTATETVPYLFVQSVSLDDPKPLADGRVMWGVTIAYSRLDPSKDGGGPVGEDGVRDPFAAPPRLNWRSQMEEEAKTKDRDGEWILNAAGDPFDPPLVVSRPVPVAIVRRVERFFPMTAFATFVGRVNSASWLGFAAGEVLCQDITSDREWNEDVQGWAWNTEYQFAFKTPVVVGGEVVRAGWKAQVLNAGMNELVSLGGGPFFDKRPITRTGVPVSQPVPLKSDGTAAEPGDSPNYLAFDVYPTADFAGLGMPSDLFSAGTPEGP